MKTIGILGGMSWESTQSYYAAINQGIKAKLGGLHSAKIVLVSVDFAEIEVLQAEGKWEDAAILLAHAAKQVEAAGADCLLIATNTMHKVADEITSAIGIPLLHIADATAKALLDDGVQRIGLLGTRFTMQESFYSSRLINLGVNEVITPSLIEQVEINRIIYDELCCGTVTLASRALYQNAIENLKQQGAEAVILGCTEIGLLIQNEDSCLPLYDTTAIHAESAVAFALT